MLDPVKLNSTMVVRPVRYVLLIPITVAILAGCSSVNTQQPQTNKLKAKGFTIADTGDQSFGNDVLAAQKPVLVDFYATWCGPCKLMVPIIESVASQYSDKIKVVRADIDRNPKLASRYSIEAVPTIAVFNKGKLVQTLVGVVPSSDIVGEIDNVIQNDKLIGSRKKNTAL